MPAALLLSYVLSIVLLIATPGPVVAYITQVALLQDPRGWNIALFIGPVELGLEIRDWGSTPSPTFVFEKSTWATSA